MVNASLDLVRNNMPELKEERTLALQPGASQTLRLAIAKNDPTTVFDLAVRVASANGKTVYYNRQTKWPRAKEPSRWVAGKPKEAPPLDFRFAYYPSKNRLRLAADINGLPKDARPTRICAAVRKVGAKEAIETFEFPLEWFADGRQELTGDLPRLEGKFEIALKAEGPNCPAGEMVKTFERRIFPWEGLPAGHSTKVYPPFTPIQLRGRTLATVLREHELNDCGLLDQVRGKSANTGVAKPLLASPMRYLVKVGGADLPVKGGGLKVVSAEPHEVHTEGRTFRGCIPSVVPRHLGLRRHVARGHDPSAQTASPSTS